MGFGLRLSKRIVFAGTAFLLLFPALSVGSLLAQTGAKKVTCEVTILRVTPEMAKQILDVEGNDAFVENGIEIVTTDVRSTKGNSVTSTPTKQHNASARLCQIEEGEYQQLLNKLEASEGCSVSAGLKTTTSDNGEAIGFAGTARPYCVSSEARRAKFGSMVNVPLYQVIEDGLVVNHQAKVSADGSTDLKSRIVINKVEEVQTFTFSGSTDPVTIQLPTTKTRQLDVSARLREGNVLVIASDYMDDGLEQRKTTTYVYGLFKSVGIGRGDSCKLFYVISAKH